jgi:hypothetical protein
VNKILILLLSIALITSCSGVNKFDIAVHKFKESVNGSDINHNEDYYIQEFLKYFPQASVFRNLTEKNSIDIYYRNKNGILNPTTNKAIRVHIVFNNNLSSKIVIYNYVEESGETIKPDAIFYK